MSFQGTSAAIPQPHEQFYGAPRRLGEGRMSRFFRYATVAAAVAFAVAVAARAGKFALSSPTIIEGGIVPNAHIYNGFGYSGPNRSPELSWSGAPSGTKSFAVTMYDPDAPHLGGWWHWLAFDIPADVSGLPEDAGSGAGLPAGVVQSLTDFGSSGYGGPAPPPGRTHRYIFTVYALKVAKMGVSSAEAPAKVDQAIRRNALAQASITAKFGK
jgi:Raf kinase inhibitor-like YbhB/YbcL family protein